MTSSNNNNQAIEGATSFEPFDAAANVPSGMAMSSDANQASTDNVIPTKQIREGWNKTLAGLNKAWTSTRTATGNFVKEKKLDESWEQAKTKTVATTKKAGESMNKVAKDLELDKKWKATVDKSAAIAEKVREQTEQLISGKKKSDNASDPEFDIPPSSAPIMYNDLGGTTLGEQMNAEENISSETTASSLLPSQGIMEDVVENPIEKKGEETVKNATPEFSIDDS